MSEQGLGISILPLTAKLHAPVPASPKTRDKVPKGYGRREQCRPFVAANAVGLTIPAPFSWGYCLPTDVPSGARAFRSPVPGGCANRVFYVHDDPARFFKSNRFAVADYVKERAGDVVIPGLSYFEREDQQGQVKVHLPYVLKTSDGIGLLFTPPINRPRQDGLQMLSGLVETAWYADCVNLVFSLPQGDTPVHIKAGEPLAQAIPIAMSATKAEANLLASHSRMLRNGLDDLAEWNRLHHADRSAYKRLAKATD